MGHSLIAWILLAVALQQAAACRIGSDLLKAHTKQNIERLLDTTALETIYWDREPLDAKGLSIATGLNITVVETHFQIDKIIPNTSTNSTNNLPQPKQLRVSKNDMLKDIFVNCAVERDRSYSLTINLELDNPFRVIEMESENYIEGYSEPQSIKSRIHLPKSLVLVQLRQRIRYDECLQVSYVQLEPNVSYDVECVACTEEQQNFMDKLFGRRMSQIDSELDTILSDKLSLGLQILFNQQRLDLDLLFNQM